MTRLLRSALRYGVRRGLRDGLFEGKEVWAVVGGVALLGQLAIRALHREPEVVFSELLRPGESLRITHEARP